MDNITLPTLYKHAYNVNHNALHLYVYFFKSTLLNELHSQPGFLEKRSPLGHLAVPKKIQKEIMWKYCRHFSDIDPTNFSIEYIFALIQYPSQHALAVANGMSAQI